MHFTLRTFNLTRLLRKTVLSVLLLPKKQQFWKKLLLNCPHPLRVLFVSCLNIGAVSFIITTEIAVFHFGLFLLRSFCKSYFTYQDCKNRPFHIFRSDTSLFCTVSGAEVLRNQFESTIGERDFALSWSQSLAKTVKCFSAE